MEIPYAAEISALQGGEFIVKAIQRLFEQFQAPQPFRIGGSAIYQGAGNPEGVVSADIGDLYIRNDSHAVGVANQQQAALYAKITGNGLNVGWKLVPTVANVGLGSQQIPYTPFINTTLAASAANSGVLSGSANFVFDGNQLQLGTGGSISSIGNITSVGGSVLSGTKTAMTDGKVVTDIVKFPSVQVPSADVNTLDDYEEGTWTPGDGSGASLTITNNTTARYIKIGQLVYIFFDISYPATANVANAKLNGLPFADEANSYGSIAIGYTTYTATHLLILIDRSPTVAGFQSPGGTAVTNASMATFRVIAAGTYNANA